MPIVQTPRGYAITIRPAGPQRALLWLLVGLGLFSVVVMAAIVIRDGELAWHDELIEPLCCGIGAAWGLVRMLRGDLDQRLHLDLSQRMLEVNAPKGRHLLRFDQIAAIDSERDGFGYTHVRARLHPTGSGSSDEEIELVTIAGERRQAELVPVLNLFATVLPPHVWHHGAPGLAQGGRAPQAAQTAASWG